MASNTAMGPSPCSNVQLGNPCPATAAPTLLVIVVGMSSMMLLVLVSIALLCRSHMVYRNRMQRTAAANGAGGATGNVVSISSAADASSDGVGQDNFILVLFPGEKYPVTCAHISPLHPSAVEPSAATAINVDARINCDGNVNTNVLPETP